MSTERQNLMINRAQCVDFGQEKLRLSILHLALGNIERKFCFLSNLIGQIGTIVHIWLFDWEDKGISRESAVCFVFLCVAETNKTYI